MPRKTREEAEATRVQVLNAALRVFSRRGFSDASLEEIAAEAQVTRGAIYWHFDSKAELFGVLIKEKTQVVSTVFAEAFRPDQPALSALRHLLVRSVELLSEDPDYRAVLEMSWFKVDVSGELAEAFEQKVAGVERTVGAITALIERGQQTGELRRDLDSGVTARAAYALMGGLITLNLMSPRLLDPRTQARAAIDVLLDGFRAHPGR